MSNISENIKHETKRAYSFHCLNEILCNCATGKCSSLTESDQYHIVDISLDGFVLGRAYYFHLDGLHYDKEGRYLEAKNLVKNVYNCKKIPTFDATTIETFELDYHQILEKEKSVKNRKAFWWSLKYEYERNHDPSIDYCGACGFIDKVKGIHEQSLDQTLDINSLETFLESNSHIANGMDLMRLCYLRHKIASQSEIAKNDTEER